MSKTIRNGQIIDVPVGVGESIAITQVSGTCVATIVRGAGVGTVIANGTGGKFGPYASQIVVRLVSSEFSEIDFDVAVTPVIESDTFAKVQTDPVTGSIRYSSGDNNNSLGRALVSIGQYPTLSNEIGHYLAGLNNNTGSTAGRTWLTKISLPCEFDAIQLVLHHHENSSSTVYSASIAATETAATDTENNRYRSIVGGVEKNTLNSTSDSYGWRSVTWSGASTVTPAATATATIPLVSFSDWIPLSSVARADGGSMPLLMIRVGVTGGTSSFYPGSVAMESTSSANNGFIAQGAFFSDASSVYATAPESNHPTASLNQALITVGVRIRSRKRGITLMCIGDSITNNKAVVADKLSSFGLRAAASITESGIPCGSVNYGLSSFNMDRYWTDTSKVQLPYWKPTIAVFAGWTPNYGAYSNDGITRYSVQKQAALTHDFIATASQNKAYPIIANGVPCSTTIIPNASQDAIRESYANSIVSDIALGSGVSSLDWNGLINDGGSPSRIPVSLRYDETHPNEAGVALQAVQLSETIKGILGINT